MATNNFLNGGEKHFKDANGNLMIQGSPRPDGTMRKDRKINEKYFQNFYVIPNRRGGDENNNGIGVNMRLEAPDLVSSATCPRTMDSSFKADSQILGTKKINGEKTLEEWKPDADDKLEVSLEENDTNGWRAEEMFKGKFVVTCYSTKIAEQSQFSTPKL